MELLIIVYLSLKNLTIDIKKKNLKSLYSISYEIERYFKTLFTKRGQLLYDVKR